MTQICPNKECIEFFRHLWFPRLFALALDEGSTSFVSSSGAPASSSLNPWADVTSKAPPLREGGAGAQNQTFDGEKRAAKKYSFVNPYSISFV
jgi:hypothetical protein